MINILQCSDMAFKETYNLIKKLYDYGFNQSQIASQIDVTDRTVRKWINCESTPQLDKFIRLLSLCKDKGVL